MIETRKILSLTTAILAAVLALVPAPGRAGTPEKYMVPVMGESWLAFDSNPAYINDHSVFIAEDESWQLIGITHDKVLGGKLPVPWAEEEFARARAPGPRGPWTALPPVLKIDRDLGETHVWAPHVVEHQGKYYCFYAAGGGHWDSMINLATSTDLETWTRHQDNPLFTDFYDARDPMVLKVGDQWVIYYTKTYSKQEPYSTVAFRTSTDLVNWSEPGFALVLRNMHTRLINSGHTESPFMVCHEGLYYLFICTPDLGYKNTRVFVSDDPFHFDEDSEITTLIAHCAEVIRRGDDYYLSHAGWFFDGMYLAPLEWKPARWVAPPAFADSGDSDDFLVSAPGAMAVPRGLGRALKAGPGKSITYEFPVPEDTRVITLVFDVSGECLVDAGGKTVLDRGDAGKAAAGLHSIELAETGLWGGGTLRVVLSDSGPGRADRPAVTFVKIYYR